MRLGFIGFGEAAFHISLGFKEQLAQGSEEQGMKIYAYDVKQDDPEVGEMIKERADTTDVELVPSLARLFEQSQIVVCATSAGHAHGAATESLPYLSAEHVYIDVNAASPMVKKEISEKIKKTKASFIDGAIMEAVPPHLHRVPIWISGRGSEKLADTLAPYGMNLTVISENPGDASAIKMFRSIFMKGFTMLLMEALSASYKFGVHEMIIKSLEQTLKKPLSELAHLLITRTAIHAERRLSEMEQVLETLQTMQVDPHMSEATRRKLQTLVDLELNRLFNYKAPEDYTDVIRQVIG